MKPVPTRQRYLAAGWVVLALGVSGFLMIALSPAEPLSEMSSKETGDRVFKTKNRKTDVYLTTSSPAESVAALAVRRSATDRDQALIHAVGQWAAESPGEAMIWLRDFPHCELRDWLACATVTAMAELEPAKAAAILEAEMSDGLPRNHAIVAVAQRWAQASAEDARNWVARLNSTSATNDAFREIAQIEAERARTIRFD